MLFDSAVFFAFLILVRIGHAFVPARLRNVYTTLTGWYFYSFWSVRFLSLIILTTAVDYWLALRIEEAKDPVVKRRLVTTSIVVNLSLLGFFKYWNFFADSAASLAGLFGYAAHPFTLNVVLPVGISFYTFQSMGYTIEVYRGEFLARRRFFDFAAYVAFFPHLVAGPIMRADTLLPQLEHPREVGVRDWLIGGEWVLWGLFKKVVIADNLAPLVELVFADHARVAPDTGLAILGAYAFAMQIYCDFSGYTDIARGVARVFGVELMRNFRRPYLAHSMQEFWRRWHISLSTWLRDYLYVSLGGNGGSRWMTYRNLMLTMVLGGLWHGASWMFVLWGTFHGAMLVLERVLGLSGPAPASPSVRIARTLVTLQLVCFSWVLFRAPDVPAMKRWLAMVASMHFDPSIFKMWLGFWLYAAPVLLVWAYQASAADDGEDVLARPSSPYLRAAFAVALWHGLTVLGADAGRDFIYFQF